MIKQILQSTDDPSCYPAEDMVSLLLRNENIYGEKDLYIFLGDGENESAKDTYAEVISKAKAIAAVLQESGKKGDHVLLLFPPGNEFMISFFASILAGMVAIPAYPPRKRKLDPRFLSILNDAKPNFILGTDTIVSELLQADLGDADLGQIQIVRYESVDLQRDELWTNPGVTKGDIALLQYTSGSTGKPKGVMVSHWTMIHNLECIRQSFGFDDNLIMSSWLPSFHDMGLIGSLIEPAYAGGTVVYMPPVSFIKSPLNWLKIITNYKATCAGAPNFAYDFCAEKIREEVIESLDLSSLSILYNGSEPIRKKTLEKFQSTFASVGFALSQFFPVYGMAETVLLMSGGDYKAKPVHINVDIKSLENNKVVITDAGATSRNLTGCGFPLLGMSIAIVNHETQEVLPVGEIGEIWTSGGSVTQGYWNNPEETAAKYNARLASDQEGKWLRTGDLGFIHDGQLYISGRLKDLIIIRGANYFPNDIEHSVENCHPALRKNANAAFSVDIDDDEKLIVIQEIERSHMRDFDENELFEHIRFAIYADHGIQADSILLTKFGTVKKTSSGKTQRFAMRDAWKNDELDILAAWHKKAEKEYKTGQISYRPEFLREWLINWMAQQLDINPDSIDPEKPISAYGLDSIKAVGLERDVNKQFGIEWPIESFLKENTVNDLVAEGIELLRK